jgi:hypothetical protein
VTAFLAAVDSPDMDPRLNYFRAMFTRTRPDALRRQFVASLYGRSMEFLALKEFGSRAQGAAEHLYETRGLSTDTEVEAGYGVQAGLGVIKGLEPSRRIRRVLIVGPGIDLAPRTGMLEAGPPESYQPWAVIDALIALGVSNLDDLEVVGADINPRVVDHLHASAETPPVLRLVTGIGESDTVSFAPGYRDYFASLGGSVGRVSGGGSGVAAGHAAKTEAGRV